MSTSEVKSCCASLYESDFAKLLLGDSFHPGGLELTARIGELIGLSKGDRVLDVASGKGESAVFLAKRFGCRVVGLDYGLRNVEEARERAALAGLDALASFQHGDAEALPFRSGEFDAVICECAFCTFPDKTMAAEEFVRVLGEGGRVGLSDLTRAGELTSDLQGLLAWIACIADAKPVVEYEGYLAAAGFTNILAENHDVALQKMVRDIQAKLLGSELMAKLNGTNTESFSFAEARELASAAAAAVAQRRLGYSIITAGLC